MTDSDKEMNEKYEELLQSYVSVIDEEIEEYLKIKKSIDKKIVVPEQ